MMDKNMESRMEAALKQDVAAVGKVSGEVPDSLRTLIARTPAAATTASVGAASIAKIATTKLALWSAGGLLTVAAAYFAVTANDKTPINNNPEPTLTPMVVTVDTPKSVVDSIHQEGVKPVAKAIPKPTATYTQAQIDSMLRAMPEPKGSIKEDDKIDVELKKRK
jgi:hypothetical protein